MALTEKLLGQSNPGAVLTTLYQLPASTRAIVKGMWVCNTGLSNQTFRIYVDPTGTSYIASKSIYYEVPIAPGETRTMDDFLALNTPGGSIGVYASSTDVVFTASGAEIT